MSIGRMVSVEWVLDHGVSARRYSTTAQTYQTERPTMAQDSKLNNVRTDSTLRILEAEIPDVPQRVSFWTARDDAYRIDYALQWDEFEGLLEELSEADTNGRLSPAQRMRYEAIVNCYAQVRSLLVQVGLDPLPVPRLTVQPHA